MTTRVKAILHKIHDLEHELEDNFSEKRRYWRYELKANRVKFEQDGDAEGYHDELPRLQKELKDGTDGHSA